MGSSCWHVLNNQFLQMRWSFFCTSDCPQCAFTNMDDRYELKPLFRATSGHQRNLKPVFILVFHCVSSMSCSHFKFRNRFCNYRKKRISTLCHNLCATGHVLSTPWSCARAWFYQIEHMNTLYVTIYNIMLYDNTLVWIYCSCAAHKNDLNMSTDENYMKMSDKRLFWLRWLWKNQCRQMFFGRSESLRHERMRLCMLRVSHMLFLTKTSV